MRHYEIVFLVHPDQSGQVPEMIERYRSLITNANGVVHRFEDWGRRATAYTINKNVHKAHYLMMNIECDEHAYSELMTSFRFNDAVLRNMVVKRNHAITEPSRMMREDKKKGKGRFDKKHSDKNRPAPSEKQEQAESVAAEQTTQGE